QLPGRLDQFPRTIRSHRSRSVPLREGRSHHLRLQVRPLAGRDLSRGHRRDIILSASLQGSYPRSFRRLWTLISRIHTNRDTHFTNPHQVITRVRDNSCNSCLFLPIRVYSCPFVVSFIRARRIPNDAIPPQRLRLVRPCERSPRVTTGGNAGETDETPVSLRSLSCPILWQSQLVFAVRVRRREIPSTGRTTPRCPPLGTPTQPDPALVPTPPTPSAVRKAGQRSRFPPIQSRRPPTRVVHPRGYADRSRTA